MDESGIEATQALDFGDYDDDVTDDELGDSTPVAYLNVACQKGFPGNQFPVYEGDNVIGRDDECKISIPLKALSREHACIEVKGESHFIYDKGSRNRTRRNKHFLAAAVRYELKHKDKLIFGDVECEYQLGTQAADDDDETGSESMFQTAPEDEELGNSKETKNETEIKPPEEEDYASDASSGILEPTQPTVGNTPSMLGHSKLNGNSTFAQNITVKETPLVRKTKRFTEDIVLPESGSDTDDEGSRKPPATLAIAAESQDDDDDELKVSMMGAATQAYVCESDITTDDEDSICNKRSLLAAPTQAFVDEDDISTCSEDSPQKKMLLTAATQAFAANSDDEQPSSKRQALEPTVAYDMNEGIEPTQGYDMDVDTEEKEGTEESKSHSILYEPTQAYVGNEAAVDKDDNMSDTSEEFVLDGDTDAEEDEDVGEIMAAPTLACDAPGVEEEETQVVTTDEPTQVVDEKTGDDATVAVGDEATQVFDDPVPKRGRKKNAPQADETVQVAEVETQVFDRNEEADRKSTAIIEDATQVFDEHVDSNKDNEKLSTIQTAATQVFDENATQVFDNDHDRKPVSKGKRQSDQTAETQVFNDDATQCFDDRKDEEVKCSEVETQVFDDTDKESGKHEDLSKQYEMATQVFDNEDDGAGDDGGNTFDITSTSTLAVTEDTDQDSGTENDAAGDEATQVFDEAVGDDQTVPVESAAGQKKSKGRGKQKTVAETCAVTDATQVIEEKPTQSKTSRGRKKQVVKTDDTVAVSDDATQVFDETVAVTEDETVAIHEDQPVQTKASTRKRKQKTKADATVAVSEDATQVFDETVAVKEDETVAVYEDQPVQTKASTRKRKQKAKADATVAVSEDATQVFDETVAVCEDQTVAINEDQTVAVHEESAQVTEEKHVQNKASRGRRKTKAEKAMVVSDDATQVFDETAAISEDQTVAITEDQTVAVQENVVQVGRKVDMADDTVAVSEDATQVFDETDSEDVTDVANVKAEEIKESSHVEIKNKRTRGNKQKINENLAENSAAKDNVNKKSDKTADEADSTAVRKSSRARGKTSVPVEGDTNVETVRSGSRRSRGKVDKVDDSKGSNQGRKGKKNSTANKEEEEAETQIFAENDPSDEPATQRYGDPGDDAATQRYGDPEDEAATQRYGDSGDEAATQRYGEVEDDDLTPELAEIEDEELEAVPVMAETSRGRSPLKSALASPKKKKSPSPKKVQFVSQDSETGSESGEPTRRSKRGNKGRQKEAEIESKATKSAGVPQNKKQTRQKGVILEDSAKSKIDNPDSKVNKSEKTIETAESTVEIETEKNKGNKRKTRGKETKIESSLENDKSETEATVRSNRRGRKSVDTEISDKLKNVGRKARVSLPAVLERSEDEIRKNIGKGKSDKGSVEEKESTKKGKSNGRKNFKGKNAVQQETEKDNNNKAEVGDHILKQTGKHAENSVRKMTTDDDSSGTSKKTKQVSETKTSGDTEQNEKRTGRQTRATLEGNKTKNPKESTSDSTNDNSGTVVEPTVTRPQRSSRKNDLKETEKSEDSLDKKRKLDHVKSDGDKREPSPQTLTRTRANKSKPEENHTSKVKDEEKKVIEQADDNSKATGKTGKGGKRKGGKVESEALADIVKAENTDEEVNNKSKATARSKKGGTSKVVEKEEKQEEVPIADTLVGRSRRTKRKESASSSNDSQESDKGETPAKRQKQKANSTLVTPKNKSKQTSTVSTPRVTSNKELETSVTNSPTLRKTTTEGGKAKVMFTGVIDEPGEKIVKELGGELVNSVKECTHLITDQVRRTVKFLCCLSRGIPIVSPQWLASSKTSAFFVDPTPFFVRDEASERKYKFHLDHSIDKASKEQVFQGFTFHVTKSVKPEPQHMSEILKCAGAKCVNKMPCSSSQGKTVVISCPDNQAQCEPAYKAGVPVMTAEFILTGILRQEVDWQSFKLMEENGNKRQATASSQETTKKRKR